MGVAGEGCLVLGPLLFTPCPHGSRPPETALFLKLQCILLKGSSLSSASWAVAAASSPTATLNRSARCHLVWHRQPPVVRVHQRRPPERSAWSPGPPRRRLRSRLPLVG